ncbi:zinc finger CCCH domain-containing protein 14 [Tripterygium wilfordii]|uniref:Zinc finger CCCH domain-containing protein 14 n=1 Tax=Tripterygium wilfordii TaxID=458696 RepID=A0A7J7DMX6_TRIWF|nr:zinc finger CCCH domain-containing protein 31-like [Tripterygium wilfordii]KAF5747720.1 zinc finger CCCH domain-containing protein 14 [Tripterygium wilfordii]
MDTRKRGRNEGGFNVNGGFKRSKQEMEFLSTGVGSKSKPCTKFFSTVGCPFGESCFFLHYVPGGYNAVAQMMNLGSTTPAAPRNMAATPPMSNGSSSNLSVKSRMCNKYNTAEGCKFGDKCHFAHGEWELGKPVAPSHDEPHVRHNPGRMGGRLEPPPSGAAASFGTLSTAKISIDASVAGAIIGKGGVNSKQICRQTGAKLSIREDESDPNKRNIVLEGSFAQIQEAGAMASELIMNLGPQAGHAKGGGGPGAPAAHRGSNYKKKICDNFTKGSCTFGDRCHFAHGAAELRKVVI